MPWYPISSPTRHSFPLRPQRRDCNSVKALIISFLRLALPFLARDFMQISYAPARAVHPYAICRVSVNVVSAISLIHRIHQISRSEDMSSTPFTTSAVVKPSMRSLILLFCVSQPSSQLVHFENGDMTLAAAEMIKPRPNLKIPVGLVTAENTMTGFCSGVLNVGRTQLHCLV